MDDKGDEILLVEISAGPAFCASCAKRLGNSHKTFQAAISTAQQKYLSMMLNFNLNLVPNSMYPHNSTGQSLPFNVAPGTEAPLRQLF